MWVWQEEVALRAAFMAVSAGRQVAVLVPTTLPPSSTTRRLPIASPTGRDCRSFVPVRTAQESRQVLEGVESGSVDSSSARTAASGRYALQELG